MKLKPKLKDLFVFGNVTLQIEKENKWLNELAINHCNAIVSLLFDCISARKEKHRFI